MSTSAKSVALRLVEVTGFEDRKNDVVYCAPLINSKNPRVVIFFPGDVQDYIEHMDAHRDNKHHRQWNLEATAALLRQKFPENHILVVKSSRMDYKTFSCFQNFVKSSQLGIPEHTSDYNSLRHLDLLVNEVSQRLQGEDKLELPKLDWEIVGFSKGCVVLNQFLYEFHHFKAKHEDDHVSSIIDKIRDMYWLDGGHSGGKNTWINNKDLLSVLCSLDINVHIHVSPYQIEDDRRPWIKKEEKAFWEFLSKHGGRVQRVVHFGGVAPSIFTHFDVLNAFKK